MNAAADRVGQELTQADAAARVVICTFTQRHTLEIGCLDR